MTSLSGPISGNIFDLMLHVEIQCLHIIKETTLLNNNKHAIVEVDEHLTLVTIS